MQMQGAGRSLSFSRSSLAVRRSCCELPVSIVFFCAQAAGHAWRVCCGVWHDGWAQCMSAPAHPCGAAALLSGQAMHERVVGCCAVVVGERTGSDPAGCAAAS